MRHGLREAVASVAAVTLVAGLAAGDEIFLKGGGRVSGRVTERSATRITIETGPGSVTLPMSRVLRIVEGHSAIDAYAEKSAQLEAGDVQGWAELARWAEERDLSTQARLAWRRVLAQDPRNPEANAGVGRVSLDGAWMSPDEAHRARGHVQFEGRWLTPAEHEAAVRERYADDAAAREAREGFVRVREAEARAREAEARAAQAETEAEQAAESEGGIPLDYVYGAGYASTWYTGYGAGYGTGYGPSYGLGYGTNGQDGRPGNGYRGNGDYGYRPSQDLPPQRNPSRPPRVSPSPDRQQAGIAPPPQRTPAPRQRVSSSQHPQQARIAPPAPRNTAPSQRASSSPRPQQGGIAPLPRRER